MAHKISATGQMGKYSKLLGEISYFWQHCGPYYEAK